MSVGHVDAVVTRLRAVLPSTVTVLDGERVGTTLPAFPYVVVHGDPGVRSPERASSAHTRVASTVTVVGAGGTREQATWMVERVAEVLAGWVPVVAGRTFWQVAQETSEPPRLDTSARERPTFVSSATFTVTSRA